VHTCRDACADARVDAAGYLSNLHMPETRGTSEPAHPGQGMLTKHWVNEIHPNQRGCRWLAQHIAPRLHEETEDS
jgi:hypothetical protein